MTSFVANFGLIALCLVVGGLLRHLRLLPATAPAALNGLIIHVALPALTLQHLHRLHVSFTALYPVAMAWLLFGFGAVFFGSLGAWRGWDRKTIGALIMTGGLSNTSFVGFPMLEALYGPEALRTGILTDQAGSFFVLSTLGLATASFCAANVSAARLSWRTLAPEVFRRITRFTPFYAMLAALALSPWSYPAAFQQLLEKLSAILVPLAMLSVGLQLDVQKRHLQVYAGKLTWGLLYKLVLGPAAIAALYLLLHGNLEGATGQEIRISIIQAGMAPMITGAIIADQYGLKPPLANLMVGIGIPLSLATVPLWALLLSAR